MPIVAVMGALSAVIGTIGAVCLLVAFLKPLPRIKRRA